MPDLPERVLEDAITLTRRARGAIDEAEAAAYREERDELLDEHGFRARTREDPDGDVLVCYPDEWVEDGVVSPETVADTADAVEVPLSGRGPQGDWESAEARNRDLVERVRAEWGEVHAANAEAFADYMGNHYARPIDSATETEVREFRQEYYPRNVWPTPQQEAVLEESLRYVFAASDGSYPLDGDDVDE